MERALFFHRATHRFQLSFPLLLFYLYSPLFLSFSDSRPLSHSLSISALGFASGLGEQRFPLVYVHFPAFTRQPANAETFLERENEIAPAPQLLVPVRSIDRTGSFSPHWLVCNRSTSFRRSDLSINSTTKTEDSWTGCFSPRIDSL